MDLMSFLLVENKLRYDNVFGIMDENKPFFSSFQYIYDTVSLIVYFKKNEQKLNQELQGTLLHTTSGNCNKYLHLNKIISTSGGGNWGNPSPSTSYTATVLEMEGIHENHTVPPAPFKGLIVGQDFFTNISKDGIDLLEECKKQGGHIRTYKDRTSFYDRTWSIQEIDELILKSKIKVIPQIQKPPQNHSIAVRGGKK